VVEVGTPGPRGPQGLPGEAGAEFLLRFAVGAIGGHRVVRSLNSTQVGYADNTNPLHGDDTLGMTRGAAVDGASVEVQRTGTITFGGWGFTPGETVFLAANGLLTQVAPQAGFIQQIGYAEDVTTLFLSIEPPIFLGD
jgi:hypothetical protein